MSYYFLGQTKTAFKFLNESLDIDKNNSDALNNLGSLYYKNKEYDKSLKSYQSVLKNLTYQHRSSILIVRIRHSDSSTVSLILFGKFTSLAQHPLLSLSPAISTAPSRPAVWRLCRRSCPGPTSAAAFRSSCSRNCPGRTYGGGSWVNLIFENLLES